MQKSNFHCILKDTTPFFGLSVSCCFHRESTSSKSTYGVDFVVSPAPVLFLFGRFPFSSDFFWMIQKMNESWSLFRPIVLEERTVSSTSCSSSSSSFATSVAATSLVFVAPSTNNNPTPTMAPTVYNHNHNHHLYQSSESILQRDQLLVLLKREHYYTVPNIPCRNNNNNNNNTNSHRRRPMELEDWRRKICQWGFRVIDHFRL